MANLSELMKLTQGNLDAWARLLMGMGGSLKPPKCYWYLISYSNKNGAWDYDDRAQYDLTIPLPDGSRHSIEQLPTGESRKMLGVWSNPRGTDDRHIQEVVLGKTKSFVIRIKNSHLPTHLVWKAYRSCLIPALKYGLSTLATQMECTQNLLRKWEFELISYLGVNRHVRTEWRSIPRELGGVGLWNYTVEQCKSWLEALLQHYGRGTMIAKKMIASLEALQLEIGCARNPLSEDYASRGGLATKCWMKAIWERVNFYKINAILSYTTMPMPRDRDCEIVSIITQHEKSLAVQQSLNRVRLKLQAIFLSCIVSYSGTQISNKNLFPQTEETNMSTYKFSRQHPTSKDWVQWRNFWYKVYPGLQLPLPLGKWISPSHRLWRWYSTPTKTFYFANQ